MPSRIPPSWELASSVMGVGVSSGTCHSSWLVFPSKMPRDPQNTSRRAFTGSCPSLVAHRSTQQDAGLIWWGPTCWFFPPDASS